MPKQATTSNANAINDLATKIKMEQAEQQYRLANYFTPYSFNPEQADFTRAGQLLEQYGTKLSATVFGQSSPNLKERVDYTVNEFMSRQGAMEALFAAGASVDATDEQLFAHAQERVFGNSRAGQQARAANVK